MLLMTYLKTIATYKGDLASLTAPPFLLSKTSMIEVASNWCEHPFMFIKPAHEANPEKRALMVLQGFLSTLKQQHASKEENGSSKKMKPLNSFLGERFEGVWDDENGTTNLVAEQVSHHPPVSAYNIWNERHGISMRGNITPKTYFSSTVHIERKGCSIFHIDSYDEDHLITMPKMHVEGLMSGNLTPELSGLSWIKSSSGFTTRIEYFYKGWLGGKRNAFKATLFRDGPTAKNKEPIYDVEGTWSGEFVVKDARTKSIVERVDVTSLRKTPLTVKPIAEQDPMESRRAWQHVADAIEQGDMHAAGHEKSKIENQQREQRKRELVDGIKFQRRYFTQAQNDRVADFLFRGLETQMGVKRNEIDDGSGGVWAWDEAKFRAAKVEKTKVARRGSSIDSGIGLMAEDMSNGSY